MLRTCSAVTLALGFFITLPALAQPSNDQCDSAEFIAMPTGGTFVRSGSSVGATSDVSDSGCALVGVDALDVWYRFVAPLTGNYSFSTAGSAFDTTLSIWQGDCPFFGSGTYLECNDDEDVVTLTSFVQTFTPIGAGSEIKIRIAGVANATGAYQLRVTAPGGTSVTGACCNGSVCTVQAAGTCSGQFVGVGAACGPTLCAVSDLGICCIGALCVANSTASVCTAPDATIGATFILGGTVCNLPGDARTPCCYADFNKSGFISPQDIFDYLNAWFLASPYAHVGGDGTSPPVVQDLFDYLNAWFVGDC